MKLNKSISVPDRPALSLEDLSMAWLERRMTQLAAMPGLNNDLGSIHVEADIAAIKHPVFPPYIGGSELTWLTLLNGRQLAQLVAHLEIRWKAFEIERRCEAGGYARAVPSIRSDVFSFTRTQGLRTFCDGRGMFRGKTRSSHANHGKPKVSRRPSKGRF